MRSVWITWEHHRRSVELARALQVELVEIEVSGSRIRRYLGSCIRTFQLLRARKVEQVIAPNPSLILIFFLALLRPVFRYRLVCDMHNAGLDYPRDGRWYLRAIARWCYPRVDVAIVTNSETKECLDEWITNILVLPDKIPDLEAGNVPKSIAERKRPHLLLVSTFAYDEPIREILNAFLSLTEEGTMFVTGRREKAKDLLTLEGERVHFTGYLPQFEYDGLLASSDVVIDLTSLTNCLVCGAYEALAAGVPAILSDSKAGREIFGSGGVVFCTNSVSGISSAILEALREPVKLRSKQREYRSLFVSRWDALFTKLGMELELPDRR